MQQPTIKGSGKGWWQLATRARGQRLAIGDVMDYIPGWSYLPMKNLGSKKKKIARYST
jgi:hypothetical protein